MVVDTHGPKNHFQGEQKYTNLQIKGHYIVTYTTIKKKKTNSVYNKFRRLNLRKCAFGVMSGKAPWVHCQLA